MHQLSKRLREFDISSVGAKHMFTRLDSLSEKLLGSKGISRKSEGCQVNGPSSFKTGICLAPFDVVSSFPNASLFKLGKVDMFWFI